MWIKDNKAHDDDDFNTASEDYDSYSKSRQKSNLMLQKDFDFESRMYLTPKNAKPSIFVLRFHLDLNKPFFSAQTDVCFTATRPYISHTKKQYSKFFKMSLI